MVPGHLHSVSPPPWLLPLHMALVFVCIFAYKDCGSCSIRESNYMQQCSPVSAGLGFLSGLSVKRLILLTFRKRESNWWS